MNSEVKNCQNCKKDFTVEPEDFKFYEKIRVPPPTFCPYCRMIRRMTFANLSSFYKRPCEKCGKQTICLYAPENPNHMYCNDCRYDRRIGDRLSLKLYERKCMCVGKADETGKYQNTVAHIHGDDSCSEIFKTGYSLESEEIVYCEKCYQQEVY